MAVEEQTAYDGSNPLYGGSRNKVAQRLTIPGRRMLGLGFWIFRVNSPTGDVTFEIRKISPDEVIVSKVWGDAGSLPTSATYEQAQFDTPAIINEEVRICCSFSGGDGTNTIACSLQSSDVKADEYKEDYWTSWIPYTGHDVAYRYIYGAYEVLAVTTQACTDIAPLSLTGNGVITSLGSTTVTQHGHCWSTSQNPTIADTKTTLGTAYQTGHFTSAITGLTAGATYYIKAYATNSDGTVYGSQVSNTMATAIGRRYWWTEDRDFHWFGEDGVEYKALGVGVASGDSDIPWPF